MNNKEFKIYLAGLIDGEGCIHIVTEKTPYFKRFRLRISIGMQNKNNVLNIIKSNIGGNIYRRDWGIEVLTIGEKRSYELLKELLDYLIVKKEEAKLAIEYYEFKEKFRDNKNHFVKDISKSLEEYKLKMQKAKKFVPLHTA